MNPAGTEMNARNHADDGPDDVQGGSASEDAWTVGLDVPENAGRYRTTLVAILRRIPPHWGRTISCGPGWFPLIARLHADLLEVDPNYVVLQVKEKFAGLRYYAGISTDDRLIQERFSVLLDNAERLSKTICELCGRPAQLAVSDDPEYPVYKTICAACIVEIAAAGGHAYRPYVSPTRRTPPW